MIDLGSHLHGPCAGICREICWHWWLHQSWSQPRGARSRMRRALYPHAAPRLSRGNAAWKERTAAEPAPAPHSHQESHYLFLLHWTIKPDRSLLAPAILERCLIERFWRKIPEIILRAAFFQPGVSQSWIRGVRSSWLSWLPAFPTQVPVNITLPWTRARCEPNPTPYLSHKISRIFFGLWQIRHCENTGALAHSWCLWKWHVFPVSDCLFWSLLMKINAIRGAVPGEQQGI